MGRPNMESNGPGLKFEGEVIHITQSRMWIFKIGKQPMRKEG